MRVAIIMRTRRSCTGSARRLRSMRTPPRHIPLSTSLRALTCVLKGLVVCAGHPEPCPAATGGSGFTIETGSDFAIGITRCSQSTLRAAQCAAPVSFQPGPPPKTRFVPARGSPVISEASSVKARRSSGSR